MGMKTRVNFATGACFKGDCVNRDKASGGCDDCIRFSNYKSSVTKDNDEPAKNR